MLPKVVRYAKKRCFNSFLVHFICIFSYTLQMCPQRYIQENTIQELKLTYIFERITVYSSLTERVNRAWKQLFLDPLSTLSRP